MLKIFMILVALFPVTALANSGDQLIHLIAKEDTTGGTTPFAQSVYFEVNTRTQSFSLSVDTGGSFPVINHISGQAVQQYSQNSDILLVKLVAESAGVVPQRMVQPETFGVAFVDTVNQVVTLKTFESLYVVPSIRFEIDQDAIKLHTKEIEITKILVK